MFNIEGLWCGTGDGKIKNDNTLGACFSEQQPEMGKYLTP